MKHIPFAMALFVLLSAHKCNEKTATATGGGTPVQTAQKVVSILDTKWRLTTVKGGKVSVPEVSEMPWVMLLKEGDKMEGFGGCNSLFGDYAVDGDRIKFSNLGSTKKFCEATQATETAFMAVLRGSSQFQLEGDLMKLMTDGTEVATLTKQ